MCKKTIEMPCVFKFSRGDLIRVPNEHNDKQMMVRIQRRYCRGEWEYIDEEENEYLAAWVEPHWKFTNNPDSESSYYETIIEEDSWSNTPEPISVKSLNGFYTHTFLRKYLERIGCKVDEP